MPSILSVIADLDYRGRSRQASLLSAGLPKGRFPQRVLSLRGPGPFAEPLRRQGVEVLGSRPRGPLSIENFLSLRKLLKESPPDLLHVWGLDALRTLRWARLMKRSELPPLVVSVEASDLARKANRNLSPKLIDWPRVWVVRHEGERQALTAKGFPAAKVQVIPPGVPLPESTDGGLRKQHGIAPGECLFMSVGHFKSSLRFDDGLFCIDLVHGIDPAVKMILIGDGPFRSNLSQRFYFTTHPDGGVVFLGARPDAAGLLTESDAVIVGHRGGGGTYAVLEGMAAGKPVVAAALPHLRPLIRDGETGFLAEPGQIPAYSHYAIRLHREPELRQRLGSAARAEVLSRFPVDRMVSAYADLYESAARP